METRAKISKSRWILTSGSVAIALALFAAPVAAQDTPAEPAPVPAEPAPAEPAPVPAEPAPAEPTPAEPTPAPEDGAGSDPTPVDPALPVPENDPLADEGEGETAPEGDVSVPRSGRYANQPDFKPPSVQWGNVRDAEKRLDVAIKDHAEKVDQVRSLRIGEKALRHRLTDLDEQFQQTIVELEAAEQRLRARALNAFTAADTKAGSVSVLDHDDLLEARSQQFLVETAFKVDQASIEEIVRLKGQLDDEALQAFDRLSRVVETINRMQQVVTELAAVIEQAELEADVFRAGSEFFVADVVFPIDGPYDLPLIDSWGYPRAPGTPDEHWHEGIDIFAPKGTPLVASERGVATRVGIAELGGLRVWVQGESGTKWYYAHMSAIAEGLEVGDVVEVGDLLGYIGNSGNAVGTPDHVHMQIHPGGGRPANPYPILKVVSDRELAAAALLEQAEAEAEAGTATDSDTDGTSSEPVGVGTREQTRGVPIGFGSLLN